MRLLALLALAALVPTVTAQPCSGTGWRLRSCLRATYKPTDLALDYDAQRDALFADVWLTTDSAGATSNSAFVEAAYGGFRAGIVADTTLSPREQAQHLGLNTEHVYPQSRGASGGNARADLHHLMPVHEAINAARSNVPFAAVPDYETVLWCRDAACTATRPTTSDDDSWSRLYREGSEPPYTNGRFEPRDAVKGDVARAAFYFATMYQVEAEDALPWPEGRRWFLDQQGVLLDWHEADPPDAQETERTHRAAAYQGGRPNPYVLYPHLVRDAFFRGPQQQQGGRDVWINELHATNDGPDTGEGVELAGRAGTDLYAWRLVFYGGHDGEPYNPADALVGERVTFDTRIPHEAGTGSDALGAVWQPVRGLWNRCHGLALFDPDLALVQFLSYGGCTFNAVSGLVYDHAVANGATGDPSGGPDATTPDSLLWSTPLLGLGGPGRPQEWSTLPAGYSLQLTGTGSAYDAFTWGGPYTTTPGRLNDYQAPAGSANRSSEWHPGDPIPVIAEELSPPPVVIDDAPRAALSLSPSLRGSPAKPGGGPGGELTVGSLYPNPARSLTRLDVALAPKALRDAPVSAEVYDVLGRRVAVLTVTSSPVQLDLVGLAPGLYVVRVTATRPDGRTQTATRRFTVLR